MTKRLSKKARASLERERAARARDLAMWKRARVEKRQEKARFCVTVRDGKRKVTDECYASAGLARRRITQVRDYYEKRAR